MLINYDYKCGYKELTVKENGCGHLHNLVRATASTKPGMQKGPKLNGGYAGLRAMPRNVGNDKAQSAIRADNRIPPVTGHHSFSRLRRTEDIKPRDLNCLRLRVRVGKCCNNRCFLMQPLSSCPC